MACTITAHHLALTVDDWAGQSFHFCKPVAKYPDDRAALREVIREGKLGILQTMHRQLCSNGSGHRRFFLGSDSAPHPAHKKAVASPDQGCAAGVYTSPILLPLTAHLLESFDALDKLEGFVSTFGREFYRREAAATRVVTLKRVPQTVQAAFVAGDDKVVPFWSGKGLGWTIA